MSLDNFDAFLLWLDPDSGRTGIADRERGALKYEAIRRRIIKIYQNRGCQHAEEIADETLDRVCNKAETLRETYEGDPALYLFAVAKNVYREFIRKHEGDFGSDGIDNLLPSHASLPANDSDEEVERRMIYLDRCLDELDPVESKLIKRFYEGQKRAKIENRKRLAEDLGITVKALGLRAFRIRARLRKCMRKWLGGKQTSEVNSIVM